MNRRYKHWILVLLVAACGTAGAWALISVRERNLALKREWLENHRAERKTFLTLICLSDCIGNYMVVHRSVPWSAAGDELWSYRMTPEGESPFCADPRCRDDVSTLRDGWGREIKIVLGPHNMLWVMSAGEDGIFQTDLNKTPYPPFPGAVTPGNDDMVCEVLAAHKILSSHHQ